jgi:cytochrome c-type biogenesis protein CcmH/NrfG
MDRLAMLQQIAAQKPGDPFPRYALAMELKKLGRHDEAWAAFSALMADQPAYVPSYLMAGGLLAQMGRRQQAASVLMRGIEAARAAGDAHALSELEAARAELS